MGQINLLDPQSFFLFTDVIEKEASEGDLGGTLIFMEMDHELRKDFWGEEESSYFMSKAWYSSHSEFKTNYLLRVEENKNALAPMSGGELGDASTDPTG